MAKLTTSELEQILMRTNHIKDIHYESHRDLPSIDFELWKSESSQYISGCVQRFGLALNLPYIEDDFGKDHERRRSWEKHYLRKHLEVMNYYYSNALRGNNLLSTISLIEALQDARGQYVGSNKVGLRRRIRSLVAYKDKYYDDRAEYVKELKERTYRLLVYLSEQSPASSSK
jgi:hypothetical protein